jgi:hypothetical protein
MGGSRTYPRQAEFQAGGNQVRIECNQPIVDSERPVLASDIRCFFADKSGARRGFEGAKRCFFVTFARLPGVGDRFAAWDHGRFIGEGHPGEPKFRVDKLGILDAWDLVAARLRSASDW